MEKRFSLIIAAFVIALLVSTCALGYVVGVNHQIVNEHNRLVQDFNELWQAYSDLKGGYVDQDGHTGKIQYVVEIHSRVRMWKGDILIFDEYNAGVATDRGDNTTLFKMFGYTGLQDGDIPYTDNCTYISIGNDTGTLSTTSTVLPNEWNRSAADTIGGAGKYGQSWLNLTCTMYPDVGPNTADCIGLNLNATDDANNLCFYDTFTEVTGIDDTFTIVIEFKVSLSHT